MERIISLWGKFMNCPYTSYLSQRSVAADAFGYAVVVGPFYAVTHVTGNVGACLGVTIPHGCGIERRLGRVVGPGDLVAGVALPDAAVGMGNVVFLTDLGLGDHAHRLEDDIDRAVDMLRFVSDGRGIPAQRADGVAGKVTGHANCVVVVSGAGD